MSLTVEAVYENGVLKPIEPLPLRQHERVQITVQTALDVVERSYGRIGWTGDAETVRRVALDPEDGLLGSP